MADTRAGLLDALLDANPVVPVVVVDDPRSHVAALAAAVYGHPAREVQTRLSAHGAHLLRTDRQGAWLFDSGGQTLSARQWQPKRFYWQQKPFAD